MNPAPLLVLSFALHQAPSPSGYSTVQELPPPESSQEEPGSTTFGMSFEAGGLYFPSGTPGGGQDIFAQAVPVAHLEHGESFELELGAQLRFRLIDADPKQAAEDYGGYLRLQDWDTQSDYGQVLRHLRIGRDDNVAHLIAGPLNAHTLGEGHMVDRYDNQLSPDYHPASAEVTVNLEPVRILAMASDVLAPRLFAGELRLDIGRLASKDSKHFDRFHAVASAAHDFGRVGDETLPSITAVLAGGDAGLYVSENLKLFAIGGAGTRIGAGTPDIGGFGGFSISGTAGSVDISGRLEGRYEGGNFRFGLFGPSYELSRYSATGLHEPPLDEERMDKNLAGFAELSLGRGGGDKEELDVSASAAVEHFTIGRTDTDFTLSLSLPGANTTAVARVIVVGIGTHPRYSVHAELRQRLMEWFYLWGAGGTLHFPQADGTLVPGYAAGAGVGMDFNR